MLMYRNFRTLVLLVDQLIISSLIEPLEPSLKEIFSFQTINHLIAEQLPRSCWVEARSQYNAQCLLKFAASRSRLNLILLLVFHDLFVPYMNFVFGIASNGLGAVVSVARLENNPDFVQKEVIHELGHVFGLSHCVLPCVMTFSNSVWEAKQKNGKFCPKCLQKLQKLMKG